MLPGNNRDSGPDVGLKEPDNREGSVQVWFIGAGPGSPDLITVKGANILAKAGLVIYAGSLVPLSLLGYAQKNTPCVDSSSLTLEEVHDLVLEAVAKGKMVARLHTGDPSLYGAMREQTILLDRDDIAWGIVPGVTAAFAAAAAAKISFTIPELSQSLIFTRQGGRTKVPEKEAISLFAAHNTAMAIYLSANDGHALQQELEKGGLAPDTTIIIARQIGWPEEEVITTSLSCLAKTCEKIHLLRQAVFLVLPASKSAPQNARSELYRPGFVHGWRRQSLFCRQTPIGANKR